MNAMLLKALGGLLIASLLLSRSIRSLFTERTFGSLLQFVGAGCLMLVVLSHVCEALHLLPWMDWGLKQSAGHYLDFWSAVLGLTLLPAGYLLREFMNRHN